MVVRKAPGSISIERYARLCKLNPLFAQGGYSNSELADRFGVTPAVIALDRRYVMEHWWKSERQEEIRELRLQRIKELEQIKRLALESYHRSRQDAEKITTKYDKVQCEECNGTGKLPLCKCLNCDGTGYVNEEVVLREVKGQAGDSSFLGIAHKCVAEIAKMEALYASPEVKVQHVVSGEVRHTAALEEKYKNVDPELIMAAKVALARLEEAKMIAANVDEAVEGVVLAREVEE